MRWRWMKKTYMENGGKAGSFWFVKADPKNSLPLFVFALHRFPIFSAPLFASFSFRSVLNCKESGLTEHARTSCLRSERTCANAAIYRERVRLSIFVYPAVSIRRSVRARFRLRARPFPPLFTFGPFSPTREWLCFVLQSKIAVIKPFSGTINTVAHFMLSLFFRNSLFFFLRIPFQF